jgi:recombinational DNA repair ATPase RecF
MQQYSDTPLAALIDDVTGDLDAKARNTFLQELQIFPQRIYTFTHIPREPFAAGARKIIFSASAAPSVMN